MARGEVSDDQREKALDAAIDAAFAEQLNRQDRSFWFTREPIIDVGAAMNDLAVLSSWRGDDAIYRTYSSDLPVGSIGYEGLAKPQHDIEYGSCGQGYGAQIYFPCDIASNRASLRFTRTDL